METVCQLAHELTTKQTAGICNSFQIFVWIDTHTHKHLYQMNMHMFTITVCQSSQNWKWESRQTDRHTQPRTIPRRSYVVVEITMEIYIHHIYTVFQKTRHPFHFYHNYFETSAKKQCKLTLTVHIGNHWITQSLQHRYYTNK